MNEKQKTMTNGKGKKLLLAFTLVVIVIAFGLVGTRIAKRESEQEIISTSTLERIINVSNLSTFQAVYNGIAKVMNENMTGKVDHYVSYDSKVKAGLDFKKIDLKIDNEKKAITVILPEIEIIDVNVDITSLDYIFMNENANTETVSAQAYKKCIEDVENESRNQKAIYELAEQNAHSIIEALIKPFVEQLDDEYQLVIE